ncbi:MAG: hypothetical protein PUB10_06365 [Clostridiales bacterium]|nr:hypothetical protein [Clostridiales bacterium]
MISDHLFERAFSYKKSKLWNMIRESQLFAVKLTDGTIGYICVEGGQESYALNLFTTRKGLDVYRKMLLNESILLDYDMYDLIRGQECLKCSWMNKEELEEKEVKEARDYARRHGKKLAGKNAYPSFSKYRSYYIPWFLKEEQDQDYLCQALEAAVCLAELLKEHTANELGLFDINEDTRTVLMMEKVDGVYVPGKTELPPYLGIQHPVPEVCNDIHAAKLKKMQRRGVWECEIVYFPEPVVDPEEEVPLFPTIILAVENASGYMLPVSPVEHYEENPEELLDRFIEAFLLQKICPAKLLVRDERSYAFAEKFCKRMGIQLGMEEELETLDEAEENFLQEFGFNEEACTGDLLDLLDDILELDEEQIKALPDEAAGLLHILSGQQALPDGAQKMLDKILEILDKEDASHGELAMKATYEKLSYVISVSLGKGCYRHIRISANSTLEELHDFIREEYGFDDAHCHAFFMDNKFWSRRNSYYSDGEQSGEPSTSQYSLYEVGLYEGKQFKYLYDFGDEWRFQCKVLHVIEEDTPEPVVIRRKGEAPEQYGDW